MAWAKLSAGMLLLILLDLQIRLFTPFTTQSTALYLIMLLFGFDHLHFVLPTFIKSLSKRYQSSSSGEQHESTQCNGNCTGPWLLQSKASIQRFYHKLAGCTSTFILNMMEAYCLFLQLSECYSFHVACFPQKLVGEARL